MKTTKTAVRKVLAAIDTILQNDDDGAQALWDVLTGLRGPDVEEWGKMQTVLTRAAAFPKTSARGMSTSPYPHRMNGAMMNPSQVAGVTTLIRPYDASHFSAHERRAMDALRKISAPGRSWEWGSA